MAHKPTAPAPVDPIDQLIALSDVNLALAEEIQALVEQARAEAALEQATTKTSTLVDNVRNARRIVRQLQARPTPKTPEEA